jgi:tetratricopeptide (TPR) repeat protein
MRQAQSQSHSHSSSPTMQLQDARRLYEQGKDEYANGQYAEAAERFREATLIQEVTLGKYHQDTIKSYWRCGRAACKAGDEREALRAFQRAARMAETSFSRSINASLREDIQQSWRDMHTNKAHSENPGEHAHAHALALEQMAEVFGLERQGDASCKNGNFAKAAEFYQRVLDIQDSLVGADSLDGADVRCKLACCHLRMKNLQQAEAALINAHECFLKQFGELHPATLGAAATMQTVKSKSSKYMGVTKKNSRKGWFSASLSSSLGSGSRHTNTGVGAGAVRAA